MFRSSAAVARSAAILAALCLAVPATAAAKKPTSGTTSGTTTTTTTTTTSTTTSTAPTSCTTPLFDGATPSNWWALQAADPSRVQQVADPSGSPSTATSITTYNGDIAPLTPTLNPRAQLVSPRAILTPGNQYWESFETYLPSTFPQAPNSTAWISIQTPAYGAPYNGSPPMELKIRNNQFRFQENGNGPSPNHIAWATNIQRAKWIRFTWHFLLSGSGWVELYMNGTAVPLTDGFGHTLTRLPLPTIDASDSTGPWSALQAVYYQYNQYSSLNVFDRGFRIAATKSSAETGC